MNILSEFKAEFQSVVSRVRQNFRWYDQMIRDSGYDKDHDPLKLPYMDEPTLDRYYYNADHPEFGPDYIYKTSGTSTGARKKIHYSHEDHLNYVQERKRIIARFLPPDCKVACSDLGTGHAASSAAEIFRELGLDCFQIDFKRPVEEHIELLNRHRPDVLFIMPMILDSIIQHGNIKFSPKKIIVVGDVASRTWKNNMVEAFSLKRSDLLDVYGSIEVGCIAYECFDCGLYHFDEHIIPETVKPSDLDEALNYKRGAEILALTSASRTVFPAIRFITYDLVEGFGRTRCNGKAVFTYERVVGRVGNEIKNGEKISLYDICEAVNTFLPGSLFGVYKDKDSNSVVVKVCSNEFTPEKADKIKEFVKRLNPDVSQMIASSLVNDIQVCNVAAEELASSNWKKSFFTKQK